MSLRCAFGVPVGGVVGGLNVFGSDPDFLANFQEDVPSSLALVQFVGVPLVPLRSQIRRIFDFGIP